MKDKKPVCMINCHDERIRGSCLRDENNKGINYCRHHQGWNDTAMCTPFPWQLAMGRWMFHSHSAPRYTSINQTYIKSTRFLLWAERRAGLFSCYCIIMEKKHKTMRSFWAGNKLRNYLHTCRTPFISQEARGRQGGRWTETQPVLVAGFQAPTWSGWRLRVTCLAWAPHLALFENGHRGNLIYCLPCPTGFHSYRLGRNSTPCLVWKFTENEQACTCS